MLSTSASLHYPFVVERPDGAYAIISYPHQGRTELFRVADTNDGLDHVKILLNRALTNPTVTCIEGLWWLFGTDPEAPESVLLAYWSQDFEGPYTAHRYFPLKMGSSGLRPAGTLFLHNDQLWRPSKENTKADVFAVILNHVTRLTPTEFEETPGKRITGIRGSVYGGGIRTLCAMGEVTLIDGLRIRTGATRTEEKQGDPKPNASKRG
jgi:hypothetical protein